MKRPLEGVIEDVLIEPSKIQPIIVNFQNGELKDEEAKKMSCGVFYDQKKHKPLLALSNGQIVYKGYKPDVSKELTRTMLVFRNRKTGKVRLVQAERWQVSPILEKPEENQVNNERDDKIAQLNKTFGSKKVKRRTEQYERMKVNVESVKEELEQTVSNVEINRLDLSAQLSKGEYITNTNLPTINREANSVKDVYNIYDIVPKDKLETLHDAAVKVLEGKWTGSKSKFFENILELIRSDSDNIQKASILIYIDAVIKWLNIPIKDAKKRGLEICPASNEINSHIIDTYSVASAQGRLRPASMRDKGVIHCMMLALTISNFVLDTEAFSSILSSKIGARKLLELAKVIAATPNKDNKKLITLKLPLPAEVAMVRKAKKGK